MLAADGGALQSRRPGTRADRTDLPAVPMTAAGGLVSTVRDLARLDAALDAARAAAGRNARRRVEPAADRGGSAAPMGLGWFVQCYRGERVVWHFGYVPNAYSSLILKLPRAGITFILLANSDGLSARSSFTPAT